MNALNKIVAVTRCLKIKQGEIVFHFRGYLNGQKIALIVGKREEGHEWIVGEDYVMTLIEIEVINEELRGKILSFKKLQDFYF